MGTTSQGGVSLSDDQVSQALIAGAYLGKEDLAQAKEYATSRHISLVEALLTRELVTKDILGQALAEQFGMTYVDLNSHPPTTEQLKAITEKVARKMRIVLTSATPEEVIVTTDSPKQSGLIPGLQAAFPNAKQIRVAYSLPEDVDEVLRRYRKKLGTRFSKIIQRSGHTAPKLIREIMTDALQLRASDIHFEPQDEDIIIRFRVDDVLQEAGRIPAEHYDTIINRVKVMASLRTDEHFAAQDGAIRYKNDGEEIDLRVSIAPVVDGEKIAIRILSRYVREFNLSNLGLASTDQAEITRASHLPFGMVLVVGPTGSGKSTTLYATLKTLNDPGVNITTIEDPVEYKIRGVNHIQVNQQTELTFSKGLRSIVRQDPDIILVGEIRDEETADIAVNAALTGHMLFSTFHANDAATAIPRLLDMGVEPFLLASTLELVLAQRLARKICDNCRASYTISEAELAKQFRHYKQYFSGGEQTLYRGKGCTECNDSGYSGRIAIFELITISPEIENLILENPSSQEVWHLAQEQGAHSMFADGVGKVKEGVTTLEEVLRVSQPPASAIERPAAGGAAVQVRESA